MTTRPMDVTPADAVAAEHDPDAWETDPAEREPDDDWTSR